MEYKGFQRTMAFFGALLILISTALVLVSTRNIQEVVGQLLFFLILIGALLYGKRGGIITAILATVIYTTLHFPTILSMGIAPVLPLILVRAAIYCVAGPLGGEIFSRIKQFMIEAGRSDFVDNDTKLFNGGYFGTLVDMEAKKFERYNTISSVLLLKSIRKQQKCTWLNRKPQESSTSPTASSVMCVWSMKWELSTATPLALFCPSRRAKARK